MNRTQLLWIPLIVLAGAVSTTRAAPPAYATADLVDHLERIDARQSANGDWRARLYIQQQARNKADQIYEAQIFRRSADARFMMLFTNPKVSAGQGYLRVESNLWFYDPSVGHWERRTERERIAGTDSRREDIDEPRLARDYTPTAGEDGKLGKYDVVIVSLDAREGAATPFPRARLWIDKATGNLLQRQDLAATGKLLRTGYFVGWKQVASESKNGAVWYPSEMRFYDEVEKGNGTIILIKEVSAKALEKNMFTKAWLEGQSR